MRAQATRPRRIWPWILVALLVLSATIAALTVSVWNRENTQPSASPTPTATMSTSPDAEPTGCLGGTTRDAAMVLAAQEDAPHTSNGAVEFATAFVRWIQRFPYPTSYEAQQLQPVLAEDSFTDDLARYISGGPDLSGGIVEAGTEYYMNTVPGVWHLESVADDDVTVSVGSGFVIDGELSSTLRSSITITTHWEGSGWTIADADGTRTPEELYQIGTPFTEGC